MSSFYENFKHKETGEVKRFFCWDDYFGPHKYGYVNEGQILTEDEIMKDWERING